MKRSFTLGLVLLTALFMNANPLPVPNNFVISEVIFNAEGKWEIEIKFLQQYYYDEFTDFRTEEIVISTNSGWSRLKQLNNESIRKTLIAKITNDSLQTGLSINPLGDVISVNYSYAYPIIPSLVFGNKPSAIVRAPEQDESIAIYGYDYIFNYNEYFYYYDHVLDYDYSIDKSPSMGFKNDTTGMFGSITGKIIDSQHLLPQDSWLAGAGITDFKPDAEGNFSARITSSNHTIDKLYYSTTKSALNYGYYLEISPAIFSTEPDSTVYVEFTVLGIVDALANVEAAPETILKISPNPLKEYLLNYEISIPVKSAKSLIEIFTINGQSLGKYPVSENTGSIKLPETIPNGTYTVRLLVNNKNYTNQKIIIAH